MLLLLGGLGLWGLRLGYLVQSYDGGLGFRAVVIRDISDPSYHDIAWQGLGASVENTISCSMLHICQVSKHLMNPKP